MASSDPKPLVRAKAIELLGRFEKAEYKPLFLKAVDDSSYSVSGNALEALAKIDTAAAIDAAKRLSKFPSKGKLNTAIASVLIKYGDESSFDVIADNFDKMGFSQSKFEFLQPYAEVLGKVQSTDKLKRGIDQIVKFRDAIPQAYRAQTDPYINNIILKGIADKKESEGLTEQFNYIKSKLP